VGSVTIGEIDAEFDHTSGEIPRPATDNSVKFTDALTKLDQVNANVHVKTVTGALELTKRFIVEIVPLITFYVFHSLVIAEY
jgi:hypothetical protein